jgi:ribosome modulation factor
MMTKSCVRREIFFDALERALHKAYDASPASRSQQKRPA